MLPALVLIAAVHLVAHLIGRGSMALALLLPPVAWGVLLGRRVAGGSRRRAWASAVFIAAMAPAVAGVVADVRTGSLQDPTAALAGAGGTVLLVLLCAAAANGVGGGPVALRLLLLPLWVAGAVVLVAGGLVLAPFGLARGTVWTTLTSLADGIRGPAMMRPS